MPLVVNLEQRFINVVVKNLNCFNPLVSELSKIDLSNPISDTGCNYIHLLDCDPVLNLNQLIVKWKVKQEILHNTIIT